MSDLQGYPVPYRMQRDDLLVVYPRRLMRVKGCVGLFNERYKLVFLVFRWFVQDH